jgi:CubicO group peptidase (beta-lactamase class C family)
MNNTFVDFEETDLANWSTGYQSGKEVNYWKSLNSLDGAGVIKSTAEELLKYAEANINPPADTLGDAILLTHQITYPQTISAADFQMKGCLGWFEYSHNDIPDNTFLFHNGGTGGFNTELYINVENQTALVVLFNTDGDNFVRRDFVKELLILISE